MNPNLSMNKSKGNGLPTATCSASDAVARLGVNPTGDGLCRGLISAARLPQDSHDSQRAGSETAGVALSQTQCLTLSLGFANPAASAPTVAQAGFEVFFAQADYIYPYRQSHPTSDDGEFGPSHGLRFADRIPPGLFVAHFLKVCWVHC